jgi:uncharacterized protein (DUF2132 family)
MKLTEQDKNELKAMKKSPWWAILEKLEREYIENFNKEVMQAPDFDIMNPETQKKVQEASLYIRARKWVFDLVNVNTMWIHSPLE